MDDPDEIVFRQVEKRILQENINIVPRLEQSLNQSDSTFFIERAENIIAQITFNYIYSELENWKNKDEDDLLKASFLLAKLRYNNLEISDLRKKIDSIKSHIKYDLRNDFTPLEQIRLINHIFYKVLKFAGNFAVKTTDNFFVNKVLEQKKGSDITLAIIYICVAKSVGLKLTGIDMYQNFLLAYLNPDNSVKFYINPFNRGIILTKSEIEIFLRNKKIQNKEKFFAPKSNSFIIKKLTNSLIDILDEKTESDLIQKYEDIKLNLF